VFEEMVLTSLRRKGYRIIRNEGYTGDGGVDGRAYLNDQHYLIQAKRYKDHIRAGDIEEFAKVCKRRKGRGLFVHTGKTGEQSRAIAYTQNIDIISGAKLLALLLTSEPRQMHLTELANLCFSQV
jgi:restriction system protein